MIHKMVSFLYVEGEEFWNCLKMWKTFWRLLLNEQGLCILMSLAAPDYWVIF